MKEMTISLENISKISIRSHANLDLSGWEKNEVQINTDLNIQRTRKEEGVLFLIFVDDCEIKVPFGKELEINRASGNARIKNLHANISVNHISGNLAVQNVNNIKIDKVSGSLLVEEVKGHLDIGRVSGNFKGRQFHGNISSGRIDGGVSLLKVHRGAKINSNGDLSLDVAANSQDELNLRTFAGINLNLPVFTDAEISAICKAQNIELRVGERTEKYNDRRKTLILGDGSRHIRLESNGRIKIKAEEIKEEEITRLFEELDNLWVQLKEKSEIKRKIKAMDKYPEIEVIEGFSKFAEEAMKGVIGTAGLTAQIAETALQEAEIRIQLAADRIEEEMKELGIEIHLGEFKQENQEPEKSGKIEHNVSEEERLIIFRMLEQKKITVEEADRLLEALENSAE
jgi:hypothetical protein